MSSTAVVQPTADAETAGPAIFVTMIGPVAFATPTPKPELTPTQLKEIELAMIAAEEGRTGAVELRVRRVERRIWPKGFDPHHELRVARTAGALAERQQRPPAPIERGPPAVLPDRERGMAKRDVDRFDKARAELNSPKLALTPKQRDARARTMRHVEDAPKAERDKAWIESSLADSAQRASSQGETVEREKGGRVNIVSRDAVKALGQSRALSAEEIDTAALFKGLYEARFADSGAADYGDAKGGGHNHEAFIAKRFERAQAGEVIGRAERAIAVECSNEPACLQVFRGVLDENKAISSFGKGRACERNTAALRRALAVARAAWLKWRQERAARHVAIA